MVKAFFLVMSLGMVVCGNGQHPFNDRGWRVDLFGNLLEVDKSLSHSVSDAAFDLTYNGSGFYGPIGLRFEKNVSPRLAVGLDAMVNGYRTKGTIDAKGELGNTVSIHDITGNVVRLRGLLRLNYYFISKDGFEAYLGGGGGINHYFYKFQSDYALLDEHKERMQQGFVPFSLRAAVGVRYFLFKNVGLNAEVALGGPPISGGISIGF